MGKPTVNRIILGPFVKDLTHHLELVGSGDCQSSCCSKLPMKGRTHLCCRAQVFDLEVIFRNALRTAYHRQVVGRRCTSDIVKTHGKTRSVSSKETGASQVFTLICSTQFWFTFTWKEPMNVAHVPWKFGQLRHLSWSNDEDLKMNNFEVIEFQTANKSNCIVWSMAQSYAHSHQTSSHDLVHMF